MADNFTPYSSAKPWMTGAPVWLSQEDFERIQSYTVYEQMYWNVPDTFKLTQLGSEDDPIYVPNPKVIIEAILRFLCVGWDITVDPTIGSDADRAKAVYEFRRLMKREKLQSKFMSQLRYSMIRGDALWHITADPLKPEGSRLSIHELDPASYFPIYDIDDLDKLVGCHLVDSIIEKDSEGKETELIRRQTYRKQQDDDGMFTGKITSEIRLFELTGWDDRSLEPQDLVQIKVIQEEMELPDPISQLPVYHWKNIRNPADPFGSSQLRGLERLFAAVNQTISDQDLAVALAGLGVYATDANDPVDDDGNRVGWLIGPGRVVSVNPGSKFERVQGLTTVTPSLDHIKYLESKILEASGVPDIAVGAVDVQVAESGIALSIKMSPLLAGNAEKELEIIGTTDQMLYDLQTMWFPAFESISFGEVIVESIVDDAMPKNREAAVDEIVRLATSTPPLITIEEAREHLSELGYELSDAAADAIYEQLAVIANNSDPFGARMGDELNSDETEVEDESADEDV